jgi:hypothetical protein
MDICVQGHKDEICKEERQTHSYIKFMWLLCYDLSNHRVVSVKTVRIARAVDMNNENTECPTRYRTRHLFNNSNTNEDIATKFEQQYVLFFQISYTMR